MEQFPHEHESSAKYNFQTKPVRYNKSFDKMQCWKSIHAMNINQQSDKELSFLRFDQFNMEEDSENLFFNNLYQLMDQSIFFSFYQQFIAVDHKLDIYPRLIIFGNDCY